MSLRLPWRAALGALALSLTLAACDTAQAPDAPGAQQTSDAAYDAMLEGIGGIEGLTDLLGSDDPAAMEAAFAEYGMAFEVVDVTDADMDAENKAADTITDCPQYFRTADRNKWIYLRGAGGSESHYIDSRGRPLAAYKRLPPVVTAPRSTYCQTNVGNWGSPASSFDGGHLIGSQLGGWGKRANIVPQHSNFNRGNWKRIEDQLAKCDRLGSSAVEYYVTVSYSSSSGLTPSRFSSNVSIYGSAWENAYFSNTSGGGSNGTSEATNMRNWLSSRGCY